MAEPAAEPIIVNYCLCHMMQRGVKDVCCMNFGVLLGIIEKLPRFIPKNMKYRLDREEAIATLEDQNEKGRVANFTFQPVPYINTICSCEVPQFGLLRLRSNFGLNSIYKAEYVADIDANLCQECKACIPQCQFGALRYSPTLKWVLIQQDQCFGCGVCRHICKHGAIKLVPREAIPALKNHH